MPLWGLTVYDDSCLSTYLVDQFMTFYVSTSGYVVIKIMMYDVSLKKIEILSCNEGMIYHQ